MSKRLQKDDYFFLKQPILEFISRHQINFANVKSAEYVIGQACFDRNTGYEDFLDFQSKALAKRQNLPENEFYKKFIQPFLQLEPQEFQAILEWIGGWYSQNRHPESDKQNPWPVTVNFEPSSITNTIRWVMVNIQELNLPGLDLKARDFGNSYQQPYRQCFFCGRIDQDETGKPFTGKKRFCHRPGCPTNYQETPNPANHIKGCCFAHWKKMKKELTQKLRYQLHCGHLGQEKVVETMLDWCRQRFEADKGIAYPVRSSYEVDFEEAAHRYKELLKEPFVDDGTYLVLEHPFDFLRKHRDFPYWREMIMRERKQKFPGREPYYPEAAQYQEILELAKHRKRLP